MTAPHRIRRQLWQVSAPDAASALSIRQELRAGLESRLQPALEAVFDDLAGAREVRLPRLELHLRVTQPAALAEQLPGLLAEAARRALAAALPGAAETAAPAELASGEAGQRLERYLRQGDLPWPDAWRAAAELRRALRAEAAALGERADWPALFALLPATGAPRLAALRRWLALLDGAAQAGWLALGERRLAAGSAAAAIFAELRRRAADSTAGEARDAWLALALWLADEAAPPAAWADALRQLAAACPDTPPAAAWLARLAAAAPAALPGAVPAGAPARPAAPPAVPRQDATELPATAGQPGEALRAAGLVLLHPWLPRLFAALGWVGQTPPAGQPFPAARLADALRLLHWLANGDDEALEFELGTAKLLLGIDPATPWPLAAGRLPPTAQAEGDALLGALLEHWRALGSTSAEGLRRAFLQRAGLLYRNEGGWLLRPQPASYDLLLDRLPWGIGLIRLPWMTRPLQVDWSMP